MGQTKQAALPITCFPSYQKKPQNNFNTSTHLLEKATLIPVMCSLLKLPPVFGADTGSGGGGRGGGGEEPQPITQLLLAFHQC